MSAKYLISKLVVRAGGGGVVFLVTLLRFVGQLSKVMETVDRRHGGSYYCGSNLATHITTEVITTDSGLADRVCELERM